MRLIPMKTHPYICGTRKCHLCLCEKLMIAPANSANLLNKRDELVSKCHHMSKIILKCFKNKKSIVSASFLSTPPTYLV